jgi:hypothetical protein
MTKGAEDWLGVESRRDLARKASIRTGSPDGQLYDQGH